MRVLFFDKPIDVFAVILSTIRDNEMLVLGYKIVRRDRNFNK